MPSWQDEITWMVTHDNPTVGVASTPNGYPLITLRYEEEGGGREDGVPMCNHTNGLIVCRMWENHPGPCIPFAVELVVQTGVYVLGIQEY